MKRPALMFYVADWRANAKLRCCPFAARGIWLEVMCLMHDSDEYGVLRWPLRDLAHAVGCKPSNLQMLRAKGVLKGADAGETCPAYVHIGTHARQPLAPITLITEQPGPVWYSSRMVRDEYLRQIRGASTRFTVANQPEHSPDLTPSRSPNRRQGDGLAFAVAISSTSKEAQASPAQAPIWNLGVTMLTEQGIPQDTARTFLGSLCSQWAESDVADAVQSAVGKADAKAYMRGFLKTKSKKGQATELKVAI